MNLDFDFSTIDTSIAVESTAYQLQNVSPLRRATSASDWERLYTEVLKNPENKSIQRAVAEIRIHSIQSEQNLKNSKNAVYPLEMVRSRAMERLEAIRRAANGGYKTAQVYCQRFLERAKALRAAARFPRRDAEKVPPPVHIDGVERQKYVHDTENRANHGERIYAQMQRFVAGSSKAETLEKLNQLIEEKNLDGVSSILEFGTGLDEVESRLAAADFWGERRLEEEIAAYQSLLETVFQDIERTSTPYYSPEDISEMISEFRNEPMREYALVGRP